MKNITKRDDGRYMIRKVVDGQRITLYANTQAEAREKLQNIKKRKIDTKANNKPTMREYSKLWYKTYKEPFIKNNTKSEINIILNKINETFGNIKITRISTLDIQNYLNSMQPSRTKEKICTYFNAILKKATDTKIISFNPFNAVIKNKKIKHKRDALTYTEQEELLKRLKNTNIEHEIMTYLMCGCRPNELPTKENFDFEYNIINVNGTKSKNAEHRKVKMSQEFAKYMNDYLSNNKMKTRREIYHTFKKICEDMQLKDITLYVLRHTFATNHFVLGTPPKLVQSWLGHGTIQLTMDTYTDIDETSSKDKIIKLYNNYYYIP